MSSNPPSVGGKKPDGTYGISLTGIRCGGDCRAPPAATVIAGHFILFLICSIPGKPVNHTDDPRSQPGRELSSHRVGIAIRNSSAILESFMLNSKIDPVAPACALQLFCVRPVPFRCPVRSSHFISMEQTLSKLQTRRLSAVAGQALLIHDYILTFPLEVDYIWNSPWHAVKVIFLLNRYGNLIGQSVFTLEELGILTHSSANVRIPVYRHKNLRHTAHQFCAHFPWFIAFFGAFSQESIHILALLRAWAIWGCKYRVAVVIISAYVLYLAACVGLLTYFIVVATKTFEGLPSARLEANGVCISPGSLGIWQWIMPLISVSLDTMVFLMVATTLARIYKDTQGFQHSAVLRVLAKDAALFFVVRCQLLQEIIHSQLHQSNAIIGTMNMLCGTLFARDPWSDLVITFLPLLTVTGQRVVLNLRRLAPRPQKDQVVSRTADRQITVGPRSALWQSVERWTSSQPQATQQNREFGDVSETASALELLVMA
ncbi:hypothetical protein OG21DRAFT_1602616 [Imleria badia]|nr:hypothetical protein OG21DRAFT_1602616 [Imleria badia]